MKPFFFFHFFLIFLVSCEGPSHTDRHTYGNLVDSLSPAERKAISDLSFYSFRTVADPGEMEMLQIAPPRELVFRFFDVDMDLKSGKPVPVSPVRIDKESAEILKRLKNTEVSALIFITNRTLLKTKYDDIPVLSRNILAKIKRMRNDTGFPIGDLHLDCDWTVSSRDNYFALLKFIRQELHKDNITLSVTIRLHQIKFREKTGIPPADRGILMFYNMDDPGNWGTANSILNLDSGRRYMGRLNEYPLALDIALPLYSQTAIFSGGRITGLIGGDLIEQLRDNVCFEVISSNRFRSVAHCLLQNYYGTGKEVSEGSLLRYETTDSRELVTSLREILKKRDDTKRLYIYDLHQSLFIEREGNDLDRLRNSDQDPNRQKKYSGGEKSSEIYFNKENIETLTRLSEIFRAHRPFPVTSRQ